MEKDIRDEELAAMQAEGEEEVICVVLTDEQGNEHEFYQDMVITVDDKQFAVLVPMEDCCCEDDDCDCHEPQTVEIYDKVFYLAHGDGLGDPDKKFKFLKRMFQNQTCQRLLNTIHPRWGMALGLNWAKHSRLKRADGKEEPYMGEKKEFLVRFAKQYMQGHKDIDYFMFGHRHIELDLMLSKKTRLMILGDWIWQFTYAVFDGEHMFMEEYVEGESQP